MLPRAKRTTKISLSTKSNSYRLAKALDTKYSTRRLSKQPHRKGQALGRSVIN